MPYFQTAAGALHSVCWRIIRSSDPVLKDAHADRTCQEQASGCSAAAGTALCNLPGSKARQVIDASQQIRNCLSTQTNILHLIPSATLMQTNRAPCDNATEQPDETMQQFKRERVDHHVSMTLLPCCRQISPDVITGSCAAGQRQVEP